MYTMNLDSLQKYIHNLKQLQQAMAELGLDQATAAAAENIKIAEAYLDFMEKSRGIVRWRLERNFNSPLELPK